MTVALRCRIRRAAFSGWRHCTMTIAFGEAAEVLARASSCFSLAWRPVCLSEPAEDQSIYGLLEVTLRPDDAAASPDLFLVTVQDDMSTTSLWVHRTQLVQSPQPSLDKLRRKAGTR